MKFSVGLDLGQQRDHSAIAVVERSGDLRLLRHVARVPLGTPYVEVIERVRRIVQDACLVGQCAVAVDATGLGAPVVEQMRRASLGCTVCAVTITGGEQGSIGKGLRWRIPKQDLISGVQVLLERRQLRIAKELPELMSLLEELRNMAVALTRTGRRRLGADGAGEHDDLVIALALACWQVGQGEIGHRNFSLGSW